MDVVPVSLLVPVDVSLPVSKFVHARQRQSAAGKTVTALLLGSLLVSIKVAAAAFETFTWLDSCPDPSGTQRADICFQL